MYSFDNDSCPIVNGSIDGQYVLPEATTDLNGALSSIENDDYTYTPSETAFPPIVTDSSGDTNFPLSVSDLINGTESCSNTHPALSVPPATTNQTNAVGTIPTNPDKNIFIITDGMEDQHSGTTYKSGGSTTCGRVLGEMTGIAAEAAAAGNNPNTAACDLAVCKPLKNIGFTVYVLLIPYPGTQNIYYYNNLLPEDLYTSTDFSSLSSGNQNPQVWNEGISGTNTSTPLANPSPDVQALQACASTTAGTVDFYTATNGADISTEMNKMLASALSSAVRITQ
jgi:hypothetical protein